MRIRLFRAFASNNSGAYTLVGSFRDDATAEEVARLIEEISVEHHAWVETNPWTDEGESPLDRFVARERLRDAKHGRGDDWPQHGGRPEAIAAGHQLLVHAPYTATLSPVFGELVYARGGRVELELDHSHDDLITELTFWGSGDVTEELDALDAALAVALPPLVARSEHDRRPAIAPVFHAGFWGERHLSARFEDLVEGVRAVRALATEHGLKMRICISETPHGVADPLALLRAGPVPRGAWTVILWTVGADRVAAMKAVRELRACGLSEARDALAALPTEVVTGVAEAHARAGVEALRAAGCDAEAILPASS